MGIITFHHKNKIMSLENGLFLKEQSFCYSILLLLTVIGIFTDKVPIQISITVHSMLIIAIGSFKSLEEMIR